MEAWRDLVPPLHPDGRLFVAGSLVAAFLLAGMTDWLWLLAVGAAIWSVRVFAMPARIAPTSADVLIAPADGVVAQVEEVLPPRELDLGDAALPCVSIEIGPFNSHVNRMPASGLVERVEYRAGRFGDAFAPAAGLENERNSIRLALPGGQRIGVVQIAGRLFRRIVWSAVETQPVEAGAVYGVIRFGCRVDLYLPAGCQPTVSPGQTMIGGETVVARL